MPKKVLWRLLIWLFLMSYIALDFFVFKGPLYRQLKSKEEVVLPDAERGIAARVFYKPIYLSQVDYAVDKMLWARGRDRTSVSDSERTYLRQVAMRDLADQYILRTKLEGQDEKYPVSDEDVAAAVRRFSDRFSSKDELVKVLKANGIEGDKELRYRLAAKMQQDRYIEKFTKVDMAALELEAEKAYEEYREQFSVPEGVRVRHVFCARLENSEEEGLLKLGVAGALMALSYDSEELFSELARVFSEDERTRGSGGDLGLIRRGRVAADFTEEVFATELGEAKIITTKLGWHLVLVTDRVDEQPRGYDEMRGEIMLSLENYQRKNNVEKFRMTLRKQQADKIKIDWDMLKEPWTVSGELEQVELPGGAIKIPGE